MGSGCSLGTHTYIYAAMAWSDNLYTFGQTTDDAITILSDWADAMKACAGYDIKPDSLEVTVSSTRRFGDRDIVSRGRVWKLRDHMTCLGYCISSVGDMVQCRNRSFSSYEAVFGQTRGYYSIVWHLSAIASSFGGLCARALLTTNSDYGLSSPLLQRGLTIVASSSWL